MADDFLHGDIVERVGTIVPDDDIGDQEIITGTHYYNHSNSGINDNDSLRREGRPVSNLYSQPVPGSRNPGIVNSVNHYPATYATMGSRGNASTVGTPFGGGSLMSTLPVATVLPYASQTHTTTVSYGVDHNLDPNFTAPGPVQTMASNSYMTGSVGNVFSSPAPVTFVTTEESKGCQLCKHTFQNSTELLKHMQDFHQVDTQHVVENRAALDKRLSHKLNQNSRYNPVPAVSMSAPTAPFMAPVVSVKAPVVSFTAPVVNNMPFIHPQTTASFPNSATISTSTNSPVNQSQIDSNGISNSLIPGVLYPLYRVEPSVISNKSCTEESSAPSSTITATGLPPPDLEINLEPDLNVNSKKRNPPGLLTSLLQQQLELMNGEPIVRSVDGNLTPKQERQAMEMIVTECLSDFYCKMCLEKFNDRETGIAHAKRQHLGWKPFQCSNCPMRFATAALRKTHKLALHANPVNQNARSEQASNALVEVSSVSSVRENTIDTNTNLSAALTSQASTNKVLPLSYMTPTYPSFGFYVDSATESPKNPLDNAVNALKTTDQEGVCILPDDEIPQEQTYTDKSKNNYLNPARDNPVHLRIFETQKPVPFVKTAQKGPIPHDVSQPQSSESRLNYKEFVSTDGGLNSAQIEFAGSMIEQLANKKFRCKICYQEVMHRKHALSHVRHLHLKELYKCPGCGDMFTSKVLKDRHRSECRNDRVPIPNHQKEYPVVNDPVGIHSTELQAHVLRSVEKFSDKFRCKKCKKTFKARGHAISHIRQSHFGRSHMCNSCGYFFEDDLLVHRSKCNTTAQISPKKGPSESEAETAGIVSNEVQHLRSMMENSIQRAVIRNQSQSWDVNYQCQLCSSQFDKRSNAEAHLWIEHIRNEWALTSGSSNVDSIYLQFLQEQFTNPLNSTGSTNKNQEAVNPSSELQQHYLYTESMDNIQPETEDSSRYMNFEGPEDEEEMVFDPVAMSENQIYVEEAGNNFNIESAHGDDGLSLEGINTIQCKVELEEPQEVHGQFDDGENDNDNFGNADSNDNDYGGDIGIGDSVNDESNGMVSDDDQTPFKVVSYSSTGFEKIKKSSIKSEPGIQLEENVDTPETSRTSRLKNRNSASITNETDEAISESTKNSTAVVRRSASKNKVTEGLDSGKLVPSALLSEAELNQLNVKALRFIREKTGQYYCIVCQRKTKLRRQLVEHVRRVHLCGESDLEEGSSIPPGKNLGGTPDNENRLYCCYCEDIFSAVGERKFHERHCLSRSSALALDVSNSTGVNVTKGIGPLPTIEQRALRFIRPDKNEFICTICKIRATKADRLITHVSTIHFGDNSQKCPKCNKDFPEGVSHKKHTAHCRGGQGTGSVSLGGRIPPKSNKNAKSKSKFKNTGVRSNFYVDSNGRLKKKIGRPFVKNVDNIVLLNNTSSRNSVSTTSKASATGSTRSAETLIDIVSDDNEEDIASDNDATQDPDWEPVASPSSAPPSPPPRSVSPTIGEPFTETPDPVPSPTVVAKPASPEENTKVVATKKPSKPSKSTVKLVSAPDSNGRLTAEQIKRAKKMIIAWSVGGKYSFSKCSECSVLFTKYENAESHIRKLHFGEGQRGATMEPSEEHKGSTNGNESDNILDVSEDDNTATESSSSKKRPNDIDLKDSAAANKKSKPNDPQDSGSEEDVYLNNDDNDDGFSEPEPEIDQMDCVADDGGNSNSSQEKDVSLEAVSPSKVNSRRVKMSMASVSADVLKKKYMMPKRVSKVLTTLTSKEFSDAQSYILKIDKSGYQCKECGAKFPRLNNISRHVRQKHFVERPHHCLKCDERFFHDNQFEAHKKLCEGKLSELNSESEIEKSPTKSPKLLTKSGTGGPSEAEGNVLDKLNDQKDEDPMKFMERLSKKGKKKRYRCQICRLVLSSFGSCLKHIQKLHFGVTPYKCEKCGENFRYSKTFQKHKNECHDKPKETGVQAQDVSLVSSKDEKANASKDTPSPHETAVPSSGSYGGNRFTESKHYVCKLCGEKLPDKPLVRYHLVSVHYGELQTMGQGMKFFDATSDKLVDDLTMECSGSSKPVEASNEIARTLEDTGVRLTRNTEKELSKILSVSSHSTSLIEKETSNHSKHPDEAPASCSAAVMSSSSECNISENRGLDFEEDGNNIKIHNSEKELIASLQEIEPYRLPDGSMEIFKKATVRIQPLRFNGVLPASLLQAAKELCVKQSDSRFTCRKCGKGFGTFAGCNGHVRIQHYGEYRYQCTICLRFLTDGLSNHMKACKKQSAKLRKAENSQGDLKVKHTELLSTEENDHNLMGGECGMSEASQACGSEYSCSKTEKESKKPGNLPINEMHQTGSQTLNIDSEVKVNPASLAVAKGSSSSSETASNKSGILNDEQISQAHSLIREIVESAGGSKKKKILYECTFCKLKDEKFARIRRHAREVHFGEKPYGCNYCGKRFSKTSEEREHSWICSVKILSQASEVVQPNPVTVAIRTSSEPSSPETVSSQPKSIIRKSRKKSKSKKSKKSKVQFGSPSSNHSMDESRDSGRSTSLSKVKFNFHKSLKSQGRDDSSVASTTTAAVPFKVNLPVVFIKEERAEETDLELPEI